MSSPLPSQSRPADQAFSLLEMLVAVAVLAVVVVLFVQMLSMVMKTWNAGRAQADNFTQARIALDVMSRDLEAISRNADLPAFYVDGLPQLAFHTKQQSLVTATENGNRPLSRIMYSVTNVAGTSLLRRSAKGFNFGEEVGFAPTNWSVATNGASFDSDIGPGVLLLRHQFIGSNGLNILPSDVNPGWTNLATTNGVGNLRSVVISLAVIDRDHLKLLQDAGKLAQLQSNFGTNNPGPLLSYASTWQAQLDDAARPLLAGGVPAVVLRGLKVFERTVLLPPAEGVQK